MSKVSRASRSLGPAAALVVCGFLCAWSLSDRVCHVVDEFRLRCGDRVLVLEGRADGRAELRWESSTSEVGGSGTGATVVLESDGITVRNGAQRMKIAVDAKAARLRLQSGEDSALELVCEGPSLGLHGESGDAFVKLGVDTVEKGEFEGPMIVLGNKNGARIAGRADLERNEASWAAIGHDGVAQLAVAPRFASCQIQDFDDGGRAEDRIVIGSFVGRGAQVQLKGAGSNAGASIAMDTRDEGVSGIRLRGPNGAVVSSSVNGSEAKLGVQTRSEGGIFLRAGDELSLTFFVKAVLRSVLAVDEEEVVLRLLGLEGKSGSLSAGTTASRAFVSAEDESGDAVSGMELRGGRVIRK